MLFPRRSAILKTQFYPMSLSMNSLLLKFVFQQTEIVDVKNIFSERIRRNSQFGSPCTPVCPRGPPGSEGKGVIGQLFDLRRYWVIWNFFLTSLLSFVCFTFLGPKGRRGRKGNPGYYLSQTSLQLVPLNGEARQEIFPNARTKNCLKMSVA